MVFLDFFLFELIKPVPMLVEERTYIESDFSMKKISAYLVAAAACLFNLSIAASAFAEDLTADQVRITTPVYHPDTTQFEPVLGTYTYDVSWEGISAAEVTVSVEQEGLYYRITAKARTYRAIDLFYKLRYRAEGTISAIDFLPVRTVFDQQENSRIKTTELNFRPNGDIEGVRGTKGKEAVAFKFNPNNFTLDPFSAAFVARALSWEVGETKRFDTFNGKTRYLISLECREKIKMDVNGETRDVYVIVPRVSNLNNQKENNKLREAKIYVTADQSREILKIASSVFVGTVTTELESFAPSLHGPSGAFMAQAKRIILK